MIQTRIKIINYTTGDYCRVIKQELATIKQSKTVYICNTLKEIDVDYNLSIISQLTGWLDIEGVGMVGGGLFSENGQVADIGSFYNNNNKSFHKYYFASGFRSGYNGYLQWTRNLILPSERLLAFDSANLSSNKVEFTKLRDDEFAKGLAVISFKNKLRAVYDPLVVAYDRAPLELILPNSEALDKALDLGKDLYYNTNLDTNYCDPKPAVVKSEELLPRLSFETVDY